MVQVLLLYLVSKVTLSAVFVWEGEPVKCQVNVVKTWSIQSTVWIKASQEIL